MKTTKNFLEKHGEAMLKFAVEVVVMHFVGLAVELAVNFIAFTEFVIPCAAGIIILIIGSNLIFSDSKKGVILDSLTDIFGCLLQLVLLMTGIHWVYSVLARTFQYALTLKDIAEEVVDIKEEPWKREALAIFVVAINTFTATPRKSSAAENLSVLDGATYSISSEAPEYANALHNWEEEKELIISYTDDNGVVQQCKFEKSVS